MSKIITLRKGLDINLVGKPQESLADAPQASEYALSPLDFEGVTPKLLVKEGDRVKAGTPLFFNKYNERVLFTSPGIARSGSAARTKAIRGTGHMWPVRWPPSTAERSARSSP